jgi:hypothetical protein
MASYLNNINYFLSLNVTLEQNKNKKDENKICI